MFSRFSFTKAPAGDDMHLATYVEDAVEGLPAQPGLWGRLVEAFAAPHMQPDVMAGFLPPMTPAQDSAFTAKGRLLERFLDSLSGIDPVIKREIEATCASEPSGHGDDDRCPNAGHHTIGLHDGPF